MLAAGVAEFVAAVKPPLKWAGGKRWLVPYVLRFGGPSGIADWWKPWVAGLGVALQPDARACSTQRH